MYLSCSVSDGGVRRSGFEAAPIWPGNQGWPCAPAADHDRIGARHFKRGLRYLDEVMST
jgi:hypothetical protein